MADVNRVRQWTVLTALGVVVVVVAGWMLVISPQRSHASDLRTQATEQQQANDRLRVQIDAWRAKEADLPEQQAKLAAIQTKIPANPALPALIRALSSAADDAGVDLVSLAPSQPTSVQTAPGATAATTATVATAAAPPLQQIALQISVTGGFFNLEQFTGDLEDLDRALLVDGFSVSPGSGGKAAGAQAATPDQLTEQIQARVFMAAPAAASAPAPAAAPAGH